MTEYCTPSDVRLLISTTLEDGDITRLIEQASAEIDKRIGTQSTSDQVVEKLCAFMTAYTLKIQRPQSEALGERRISMGRTLDLWAREIERLFTLCAPVRSRVKSSSYQKIDEDLRYPG